MLRNYQKLYEWLVNYRGLSQASVSGLADIVSERWNSGRYGDLPKWERALLQLPIVDMSVVTITDGIVQVGDPDAADSVRNSTAQALRYLSPWRKGPFAINGVFIDTEWRSDWKWERIKPHITPLGGRFVLDVGCGSGYHCWRMMSDGAQLALGIEPSQMSVMQYEAVQRYAQSDRAFVLPLTLEQLPEAISGFDAVFSMGVLYHQKSPIDHLLQLKYALRKGGELVLETLVVTDGRALLVPNDRYAKMPNVWFLPSPSMLVCWLERCGFENIRVVDINQTSLEEQRTTEWMPFESLRDFLDPSDFKLTREGHPAPIRAIVIAQRP